MKQLPIGTTGLQVSAISLGCMRITALSVSEAQLLLETAIELGITFFDHADIYAGGEAEHHFAQALPLKASQREKIVLQSKCGIRPGICYDFSTEHILRSVEDSLRRLGTDYLDFLLLHRPDALVEPEEVAEAFRALKAAGKVRHFGVSNQNPQQIQLLAKYCDEPLHINQLQLSIAHCPIIDQGIHVNTAFPAALDRDGGILDFCRLNDITLQAWSPFQYGFFEGVFIGSAKYAKLNQVIDRLAAEYEVEPEAIAVAWIMRHPAKIQTIVGTTNAMRLRHIAAASEVNLSREEWYELYLAADRQLP